MIRKYLIAGIFTLLPLAVTLWVFNLIFKTLVNIFRSPISWVAGWFGFGPIPYWVLAILCLLAMLVLLVLAGMLMGNLLGRKLLHWVDNFMLNIPFAKGVYGATKQLIGALQRGKGGGFRETVLVEWPMPGSYTLGLVARHDCSWVIEGGENMVAVYVPTAPNPTSGYVIMVESSKVRPLGMSPEQVLTWAVSAGVVVPITETSA